MRTQDMTEAELVRRSGIIATRLVADAKRQILGMNAKAKQGPADRRVITLVLTRAMVRELEGALKDGELILAVLANLEHQP